MHFEPGTEFRLPPRPMTRERMRWYVDIQDTVRIDDGRIHAQPPTIHDDDEYARSQGLPGEVTNAGLGAAIAGTSANSNALELLNLAVSDPPTQGEMQALANKLDALIAVLRR